MYFSLFKYCYSVYMVIASFVKENKSFNDLVVSEVFWPICPSKY